MMKIICIIPAWNEEKNIAEVIREVKKEVDEVVVIDDCSSDKTSELARKAGAVVLRHVINRGQGAALQTGTEYALSIRGDIVVHFDGDGQFLAREIKKIIKPLLTGEYDVVFGSRFLGKQSKMPAMKEFVIMPIARLINLIFFKIKLSDPQSGFRAMSKYAAKEIIIEQDGMAHCTEIIHKVFKNKLKNKEVPITVIYNKFGQSFDGGIRILKDMILAKLLG